MKLLADGAASLREGFSALGSNPGLALLMLSANLGLAALLAVPVGIALERDLRHKEASRGMMYGFDHTWWSPWSESGTGPERDFRPDVLGRGFAYRNLELLVRGHLPAGLFAARPDPDEPPRPPAPHPVALGLGLVYMLLGSFSSGGLLGVFRAPAGGWTFRSFLHGCGFYWGRLFRVSLLALLAAGVVFALHSPFARWLDARAHDAVSETGALALSLTGHAVLLLALLAVHAVSSFAKVAIVIEERSSAALAWLTSLGFCLRSVPAVLAQYAAAAVLAAGGLALFGLLDGAWATTGWRSQLLTFALLQAFMLGRIAVRLGLMASQVALYKRRAGPL